MSNAEVFLMYFVPLIAITAPYFLAKSESAMIGLVIPYVSLISAVMLVKYVVVDTVSLEGKIASFFAGFMVVFTALNRLILLRRRTGRWVFHWNS
jgi:hypothetical protein